MKILIVLSLVTIGMAEELLETTEHPHTCNCSHILNVEKELAYPTIPPTSFNCWNRYDGYYADVDVDCTIFHYCQTWFFPTGLNETVKWDFACPEGTIFNQKLLACTQPGISFECKESPEYYWVNYILTATPPPNADKTYCNHQHQNSGNTAPGSNTAQPTFHTDELTYTTEGLPDYSSTEGLSLQNSLTNESQSIIGSITPVLQESTSSSPNHPFENKYPDYASSSNTHLAETTFSPANDLQHSNTNSNTFTTNNQEEFEFQSSSTENDVSSFSTEEIQEAENSYFLKPSDTSEFFNSIDLSQYSSTAGQLTFHSTPPPQIQSNDLDNLPAEDFELGKEPNTSNSGNNETNAFLEIPINPSVYNKTEDEESGSISFYTNSFTHQFEHFPTVSSHAHEEGSGAYQNEVFGPSQPTPDQVNLQFSSNYPVNTFNSSPPNGLVSEVAKSTILDDIVFPPSTPSYSDYYSSSYPEPTHGSESNPIAFPSNNPHLKENESGSTSAYQLSV